MTSFEINNGSCKHKKGVVILDYAALVACVKHIGRLRKNEDEQRPQRVMAKRHTKTPAQFLNTLSDSDMMLLDPVPTLGSHKLSTGTGSSDQIGPAQSLEGPLLNYTKAQSVK